MEVKVLRSQSISPPSIQVFAARSYNEQKSLPVFEKACLSQCYARKMLINERPPLLKKQSWVDNRQGDGCFINRFHSEVVQSYSHGNPLLDRKNNSKFFASNFLQGSSHFIKARTLTVNKPANEKNNCISNNNCINLPPRPLQLNANEDVHNLTTLQKTKQTSTTCNDVPVVVSNADRSEGTKSKHKDKEGRKRKVKSGKRRKGKSGSSSRRKHKSNKPNNELILPIKKELGSCFSVYSTQILDKNERQHKPTAKQIASKISDARETYSKSSCGYREKKDPLLQQRRNSHCVNLPPATPKFQISTTGGHTPLVSDSLPVPCGRSSSISASARINLRSVLPSEISKRSNTIILPPTHNKTAATSKNLVALDGTDRRNALAKIYKSGNFVKLSVNGEDMKKTRNSLGERLTLIHNYGSDYQVVTQRVEMQKRKEAAIKKEQEKANKLEEINRIKQEQRKKIYALNRLMTEHEHNNFRKFMESLDAAKPSDAATE